MRSNMLRQKLTDGEPTVSTHVHTIWPNVVEAIGHTGRYDYVEFVAEYGPFDLFSLDNLHMNSISAYALRVTTAPAENSLSTRVCQCQGSLLPYSTNNVLSHHAISDV